MPISARMVLMFVPLSVNATPSTTILPELIVSKQLMLRKSVDFPDPLGPMITNTSPAGTRRLTSSNA